MGARNPPLLSYMCNSSFLIGDVARAMAVTGTRSKVEVGAGRHYANSKFQMGT
jgi:hypothetical protein